MKKSKFLMIGTTMVAAMLAAGCQKSNNSAGMSHSHTSSTTGSARVKNTTSSSASQVKGTLSTDNLSPKETMAIVAVYGAKKYGDNWSDLVKGATKSDLEVNFLSRNKYPKLDKGQGYVYEISSKDYTYDTRYTLEGDGSSQIIYFYDGNDYLGSNTIAEMVKYLNDTGSDSQVNNLADNAVINGESNSADESNNSTDSDSDDSSDSNDSTSSNIPGDAGTYTTPSNMRGDWYYYDGNDLQLLSITNHKIYTNDSDWDLHKQKSNFDSSGIDANKYGHIGNAATTDVSGMQAISVRAWTQSGGSYELYAYTTAKGHPVMLQMSSTGSIDGVFWKSKSVAEKYDGKTFSNINEFKDWK